MDQEFAHKLAVPSLLPVVQGWSPGVSRAAPFLWRLRGYTCFQTRSGLGRHSTPRGCRTEALIFLLVLVCGYPQLLESASSSSKLALQVKCFSHCGLFPRPPCPLHVSESSKRKFAFQGSRDYNGHAWKNLNNLSILRSINLITAAYFSAEPGLLVNWITERWESSLCRALPGLPMYVFEDSFLSSAFSGELFHIYF